MNNQSKHPWPNTLAEMTQLILSCKPCVDAAIGMLSKYLSRTMQTVTNIYSSFSIDACPKDGGEKLYTKMLCVL